MADKPGLEEKLRSIPRYQYHFDGNPRTPEEILDCLIKSDQTLVDEFHSAQRQALKDDNYKIVAEVGRWENPGRKVVAKAENASAITLTVKDNYGRADALMIVSSSTSYGQYYWAFERYEKETPFYVRMDWSLVAELPDIKPETLKKLVELHYSPGAVDRPHTPQEGKSYKELVYRGKQY